MSFDVIYHQNIEPRSQDFEKILNGYRKLFQDLPVNDRQRDEEQLLRSSDMYHFSLQWMLQGSEEELYDRYIFDIRPMTDDRPYYSAYLKTRELPIYLDQVQDVSEEWGYLILLGVLAQSVLFGVLIVLLPLAGRWRELFKDKRGTLGVIVYYACLGLGYMLIEIFLIQRLVFFLGNPIFSATLVIAAMLVLSGLGSLVSIRLTRTPRKTIRLAAAGIIACLIFYLFGLGPVANLFLGSPLILRAVITIVIIAPAAFFLGMPFPSGLAALSGSRPALLPWAWGMNGALSVTGTVLASLISLSSGFRTVLLIAAAVYAVAGLIFPANEKR